jgi:outer membrane protein TolC
MRWKSLCGALALMLAVVAGCKQQCFVTEGDLNTVQTSVFNNLDNNPNQACQPLTHIGHAPPTLDDLDRKVRFISLQECIAIALEQGSTGFQNLQALAIPSLQSNPYLDPEIAFAGNDISTGGNDSIRVLSLAPLSPAQQGALVEQALAKFDAVAFAGIAYNGSDSPIGTPIQTFQAGQTNLTAIESMTATAPPTFPAMLGVAKPLATGGVAGVTFNVPYSYTNLPARVNPSYQPALQFAFEQPLLQGFGVEINQLLPQHPLGGGSFFGGLTGPGGAQNAGLLSPTDGILITRIRFDQARAEFERLVNFLLINTEFAYWNLYNAYFNLYAQEQALRFAYETYKLSKAGYEAGRVKAADFYQTRGQYESFRASRLQAINQLLDSERQLRGLLGLQIDDGTRLMPSDEPTLAPYKPDWDLAAHEALDHKPELYLARQEVKVRQLNLVRAKHFLLPEVNFTATYDWNSIGGRLDGPDPSTNAFRALSAGGFNNWSLGIRGRMPIGFRAANANVRRAQIDLARAMEVLKDQELKSLRFLAQQYRLISTQYELIRANRAQREAYGEQLKARYQEFLAGRGTLDILLEAQRSWANALSQEYNAIALYNISLAGFEFAKGTITRHDNVTISEGALPQCASVRAVEHQRQRTAALVLRQRAAVNDACGPNGCAPVVSAPNGNGTSADAANGNNTNGNDTNANGPNVALPTAKPGMSLPAYLQVAPPLKDVPTLPVAPKPGEPLPAPTEAKINELTPLVPENRTALPAPAPGSPRPTTDFGSARPEQPREAPGPQIPPPLSGRQ